MAEPGDLTDALVAFLGALRRGGVPAGPDRGAAFTAALHALGAGRLYWAGRLTLCGSVEDITRYDLAYAAWVSGVDGRPAAGGGRRVRTFGVLPGADGGTAAGEPADLPALTRASGRDLLRHRDVATLTTAERDEVRRLVALLRPVAPRRPGRRHREATSGRVDPRRSLAAMRRAFAEPGRLARRRPVDRPRRLVLLLDVSGSMAPYADTLLRFGHAALRCRPGQTEVFTLGTRLTRLTRALRRRDPDTALAAASAAIPDWRGGTRLGEGVRAFVRRYGHPGLARRAVVVIFSDGWERGDPAPLGAAVARLRRLAHRLIWVSPHRDRPGFAPRTGGLTAVLPYLDDLVAGHSLEALAHLSDRVRQ